MHLSTVVTVILAAGSLIASNVSTTSSSEKLCSPKTPRGWNRTFRNFNSTTTATDGSSFAFSDNFGRAEALGLLVHLKGHPKDQKRYANICQFMNGSAFRAITELSNQEDLRKDATYLLMSRECMANISPEIWSLITPTKINNLRIAVNDLPIGAIPLLDWNVMRAALLNYKRRITKEAKPYNGWCRYMRPRQFSREIWTEDMWSMLTADCVADMVRWKSQRAAINLIASIQISPVINKPEIIAIAKRIVRLSSIKKVMINVRDSPKTIMLLLEEKIDGLLRTVQEQVVKHYDFLTHTNKVDNVQAKIKKLESIVEFSQAGASTAVAHSIVFRLLSIIGAIDSKSVITWEALSLFATKSPNQCMLEFISRLVQASPRSRLPIDSLVKQAFGVGSMPILLAIIGSTKNWKLLKLVSQGIESHRKILGEYNCRILFNTIRSVKFPESDF